MLKYFYLCIFCVVRCYVEFLKSISKMATRSKQKLVSPTQKVSVPSKRVENSWILLMKSSLLNNNNFSIITLPHPATGKPTKYCLDEEHNKMYEIVSFNEDHRSWLIGETVKSDGSLKMLTPVNPLFLILPRLKAECSSRAIPLENLLSEKGFDKIVGFVTGLDNVADQKGPAEIKAYKYNEDKTLKWLEERVHKLAKLLKDKNVHVTSGAVSATFVPSNINSDSVNFESYLKYSHGIISEYLQDDLIESLEKRFNFNPESIESFGTKRKSDVISTEANKKIKYESSEMENADVLNILNQKSTEVKQKPITAKEKARQKAANGTKTISSFFTKK